MFGLFFCVTAGNGHGLIRKYALNVCRQCFREKAKDIGFIKVRTIAFDASRWPRDVLSVPRL